MNIDDCGKKNFIMLEGVNGCVDWSGTPMSL